MKTTDDLVKNLVQNRSWVYSSAYVLQGYAAALGIPTGDGTRAALVALIKAHLERTTHARLGY